MLFDGRCVGKVLCDGRNVECCMMGGMWRTFYVMGGM